MLCDGADGAEPTIDVSGIIQGLGPDLGRNIPAQCSNDSARYAPADTVYGNPSERKNGGMFRLLGEGLLAGRRAGPT